MVGFRPLIAQFLDFIVTPRFSSFSLLREDHIAVEAP